MNRGPLLFLGLLIAMASSWCGMVLGPNSQIGRQTAVSVGPTAQPYPALRPGLAQAGADVYRANGCYYCHTEQVHLVGLDSKQRPVGADFERNWGKRQSVAQDYLYDSPVMLGQVRLGPDLSNIGVRQSDENWQLLHLYNPRLTVPNSIMPRYPYLFEKRKEGSEPGRKALVLPEGQAEAGYQIFPKPEALALVAYLQSLRADLPLPEAPLPKEPEPPAKAGGTNAAPAQTNAPAAGATNVPNSPGPK